MSARGRLDQIARIATFAPTFMSVRGTTRASPVPAWPGATFRVAIRRVAYFWTISWLIITLATTNPANTANCDLVRVTIAITIFGIAACLRCDSWVDPLTVGMLAIGTLMASINVVTPSTTEDPRIMFWLPNLVVISAGLLLSQRWSLLITLTTASSAAAVVLWRMDGQPNSVIDASASAIYALVDGFAALIVFRAAASAAELVDHSVAAAERSRESMELMGAISSEAKEMGRIVHDTVMNTLSGISRSAAPDLDAVRWQCAKDAVLLKRFLAGGVAGARSESPSWNRLAETTALHLNLVGATREEIDVILAGLPTDVAHSLFGAISEALRNVHRHAGVSAATIEVHQATTLRIDVVDSGRGFDGNFVEGRGLANSVRDRCREIGVKSQVKSTPEYGTRITLTYAPETSSVSPIRDHVTADQFLSGIVRSFIWKFSTCLLVLCGVFTILTWGEESLVTSGVAWLIFVLVVLLSRSTSGGSGLATWVTTVGVIAIPIVVLAPGANIYGCGRVGLAWWGTDGAVAICTILLFMTRSYWPIIVGMCLYAVAVAYVALQLAPEDECYADVLVSGLSDAIVVLGMVIFRVSLVGLAARASYEQSQSARSRSQLAAERARLRVLSTRREAVINSALALVEEIAKGVLDPTDADVRAACAREESYLREITHLDPRLLNLGDHFARALSFAHNRGIRLTVRAGEVDAPTEEAADEAGRTLMQILDGLGREDAVTVSVLAVTGGIAMTIVVTSGPGGAEESDTDDLPARPFGQSYVQIEWRD